jgi:hypothetical protein
MALAMALACLANSNHSDASAVGAPSDPYHGPAAARWQSFVVTELADRRQRRTTCHPPKRSRAKRRSRARYSASFSGRTPRPALETHPRYARGIARRNRRKSRASRMCTNGQRNGPASVGIMRRNDIAPRLNRHAACPRVRAGFLLYRLGWGSLAAVMSQRFVVLGRLQHSYPLIQVGDMLGTLPHPRSAS